MKMDLWEKLGLVGTALTILLGVAAMYGWVVNIIKLIGLLDGGVTAWVIARAVGVFAGPLGAVLGYF